MNILTSSVFVLCPPPHNNISVLNHIGKTIKCLQISNVYQIPCRTAVERLRMRNWVASWKTCWNLWRMWVLQRWSWTTQTPNKTHCNFQDYDTSDLADLTQTIMKGCDTNTDGKVSKKVIGKFIIKTFWFDFCRTWQ